MAQDEITLEYAIDELEFTGEPGEPGAISFFTQSLRRVKLALKAAQREFTDKEGQAILHSSTPAAAQKYHGKILVKMNGGTGDDVPYVCIQNNGGAYAWREITIV